MIKRRTMVELTIDNQRVRVKKGTTILEAADRFNITIPTLCHHENLTPLGSCRLCTVEVIVNGISKLTTACTFPVEQGIEVRTTSQKALEARRLAAELLLAKCPTSAKIKSLAQEIGVAKPRIKVREEDCILCELCVRTCREIVGRQALKFINRGLNQRVEPRIDFSPDMCIGCGSCAYVCPTGAIKMEDKDGTRVVYARNWEKEFKLKKCKVCGNYWAPEEQLEYIRGKLNLPPDFFDVCPNCR